ncbi:hypothetical protein J1614_005500 [Plenodomus biglobosus]|nr:hypothetical protein J1614_005500 [Plenodomus biglobosus]
MRPPGLPYECMPPRLSVAQGQRALQRVPAAMFASPRYRPPTAALICPVRPANTLSLPKPVLGRVGALYWPSPRAPGRYRALVAPSSRRPSGIHHAARCSAQVPEYSRLAMPMAASARTVNHHRLCIKERQIVSTAETLPESCNSLQYFSIAPINPLEPPGPISFCRPATQRRPR